MPKVAAKTQYFTPELFAFLLELRYNNTREWFAANKPRYEALVKKPLLAFIEDFAPELEKINPQFEVTKRSMFRIHRDTRFRAD
ncbi:DUF2461 family protein, partial [Klebsiella quasipneumoniae]|uniref:DUF2461 family protein n=1 Tax=Klebsiella quasipneumoniae TaxID=1463165 RepID=UPI0019403914